MMQDELIIPTNAGSRICLWRPEPDTFHIEDIAAGVARKFRWSGQSDLTVAEHSVSVSKRLTGVEAQWGLMHDAAEAFLPDVPRPLKKRLLVRVPAGRHSFKLHTFDVLESRVLRAISIRFGLPWPIPPAVTKADDMEMAREARDLFGAPDTDAYPEPLGVPIVLPLTAEELFLRRFNELFREYVE